MITNNPHMKKGNVARTLLIILGVVIALYLSVSSGALSADLTPSSVPTFSKSLAQEKVASGNAESKIVVPVLKESGLQILSLLRLDK